MLCLETFTTDHGGEVLSNNFHHWLGEQGIFHMAGPPSTPNNNAIIERSTQTLEYMAFAMLETCEKPKGFWPLAFKTARQIVDRIPCQSNSGAITSYEAYYGGKPDLSSFRISGCVCYAYVAPKDRKKLNKKCRRGVFVGFSEERRGFKILLDGKSKTIVARSVVFNEKELIDRVWCRFSNNCDTTAT